MGPFPPSSAGDVNGDGFNDPLIGASGAGPKGNASGASYVIFAGQRGPGMSLTGLVAGEQLAFGLNGNSSLDCEWKAVSADTTHEVELFMRDRVFGSETVGGNVFGYQSDLLNVFCHNIDTSRDVHLVLIGETSSDCGAQGLLVNPEDHIDSVVIGNANQQRRRSDRDLTSKI